MSHRPFRYWLALHPDVQRPVGGVKQMHRLAEALAFHGRDVSIIQDSSDFHPGWFSSNVNTIALLDWNKLDLDPLNEVVIVPETYITSLPTYRPELPKIIFNQNSSYTFGLPSSRVGNAKIPVLNIWRAYLGKSVSHVLCVSQYDHSFFTKLLGLPSDKVSLVVNALEADVFSPSYSKKKVISYMPRKNSPDAQIVHKLLNSFLPPGWCIRPIVNCSLYEVAQILADSSIFLSFGHPEGFGLPVAEALASACYVVGYSGLGGRELFKHGSRYGAATEVAYGDFFGFVTAVCSAITRFDANSSLVLHSLHDSSNFIRDYYSIASMRTSVYSAINAIEARRF
jgi:hypothetical protein